MRPVMISIDILTMFPLVWAFSTFYWYADAVRSPTRDDEANKNQQAHVRNLGRSPTTGPSTSSASRNVSSPIQVQASAAISYTSTGSETFERLLLELNTAIERSHAVSDSVANGSNRINEIHKKMEKLQLHHEHRVGNGNKFVR